MAKYHSTSFIMNFKNVDKLLNDLEDFCSEKYDVFSIVPFGEIDDNFVVGVVIRFHIDDGYFDEDEIKKKLGF